jgi:hypothetical protein
VTGILSSDADDQAQSTGLVTAALEWRAASPPDQAATSELLRTEMLPLYLCYIEDHIEGVGSIGKTRAR